MQTNKHRLAKMQTNKHELPSRPKLKLSDLETTPLKDIDSMFGVWNEADHCD